MRDTVRGIRVRMVRKRSARNIKSAMVSPRKGRIVQMLICSGQLRRSSMKSVAVSDKRTRATKSQKTRGSNPESSMRKSPVKTFRNMAGCCLSVSNVSKFQTTFAGLGSTTWDVPFCNIVMVVPERSLLMDW